MIDPTKTLEALHRERDGTDATDAWNGALEAAMDAFEKNGIYGPFTPITVSGRSERLEPTPTLAKDLGQRANAALQEGKRMADTNYTVIVVPDEEDGGYYAYIPDLQGCMGDGETPQDAVADTIAASHAWIEAQQERGEDVPKPGEESERFERQMQEQADYIENLETQLAAAIIKLDALQEDENPRSTKEPFSEYGHYGENNPPVGMSSPSDKDYEV